MPCSTNGALALIYTEYTGGVLIITVYYKKMYFEVPWFSWRKYNITMPQLKTEVAILDSQYYNIYKYFTTQNYH